MFERFWCAWLVLGFGLVGFGAFGLVASVWVCFDLVWSVLVCFDLGGYFGELAWVFGFGFETWCFVLFTCSV